MEVHISVAEPNSRCTQVQTGLPSTSGWQDCLVKRLHSSVDTVKYRKPVSQVRVSDRLEKAGKFGLKFRATHLWDIEPSSGSTQP